MPQRSRVNPKPYLNCFCYFGHDDNVYHKKSIDYNGKVSSCPHSCVVLDVGYQLIDVVWWGGSSHHVEDKLLLMFCHSLLPIYSDRPDFLHISFVEFIKTLGMCPKRRFNRFLFSNSDSKFDFLKLS